jgi:hypothetical protein
MPSCAAADQSVVFDDRIQHVFWMHTTGRVSKREEKAFSLSMLFVLISHYKPCEKSLLYPIVKKLPTVQQGCLLCSALCESTLAPERWFWEEKMS